MNAVFGIVAFALFLVAIGWIIKLGEAIWNWKYDRDVKREANRLWRKHPDNPLNK